MTRLGQEHYIHVITYLHIYGIITDEEFDAIIERLKNAEVTSENGYRGNYRNDTASSQD